MNTKNLGNLAENIASRYLQEKGYEILEKNYEIPFGEVDIIAKSVKRKTQSYGVGLNSTASNGDGHDDDGDGFEPIIIFVEVKANKMDYGPEYNPETRVNPRKYNKLVRTAQFYMEKELDNPDIGWQIDVISVTFDKENKKASLTHFKNV